MPYARPRCNICHIRPARAKIGPGPKPKRCAECYHAKTQGLRDVRLAEADERIAARQARQALEVLNLPRNWCRCPQPVTKTEGPLVVCALCTREVAA